MIKFLVDTKSSLTDVNGNRYHFATITSTATGRQLRIKDAGGESNAVGLVRELTGASWNEINSTQADVKITRFKQMRKHHENHSENHVGEAPRYEHEFTARMFNELVAV